MSPFLRWLLTGVAPIVTVVLAVGAASLVLAAWRARSGGWRVAVRRTVADAAPLVALGAIAVLSFNDPLGNQPDRVNLLPFRDQWWALRGEVDPWLAAATLVGNVVLFVPLGATLAGRFPVAPSGRLLLAAAGTSLAVEVAQAALDIGRLADVTDLLANTVGAGIGVAAWRGISVTHPKDREENTSDAW